MTATRYIYIAQNTTAQVYCGFNKRAAIKAASDAAQQTRSMVYVIKFFGTAHGEPMVNLGLVATRFPRKQIQARLTS